MESKDNGWKPCCYVRRGMRGGKENKGKWKDKKIRMLL